MTVACLSEFEDTTIHILSRINQKQNLTNVFMRCTLKAKRAKKRTKKKESRDCCLCISLYINNKRCSRT